MPFEMLHDGFVRRFTPMAPRDWMSIVEGLGVDGPTALPLFVFLGEGTLANRIDPIDGSVKDGMPVEFGVDKALYPLNPLFVGNDVYRDYALDWVSVPAVFPKFFALFIEGLNPSDDPNRQKWGFSTDFEPHDGGPFEVVYGQPLPRPWLQPPFARLGDKALIRTSVDVVSNQLIDTFRRWYGRDPAAKCRDGETRAVVVDPSRIFVVGKGRAATLALDLLNQDPAAEFEFAGAALVVGSAGGTLGGRVIADPEGLVVVDVLGGNFPVGIVHTPDPSRSAKAILVICDLDDPHTGDQTDKAGDQYTYPLGPPESGLSRSDLEGAGLETLVVDELVRLEYTVFATLNEWTDPLGLGVNAFTGAAGVAGTFPIKPEVTSWLLDGGVGSGNGKMQVLGVPGLGEAWPHIDLLGQEGILAIFNFFASFEP